MAKPVTETLLGPDSDAEAGVPLFSQFLKEKGLELTRGETAVLQINTGLLCNQACRHCHLEAGPDRHELMSRQTASDVIAFAAKNRFKVIDITGGAPELNPNLPYMIENLAPLALELILRSNLTVLADAKYDPLIDLCREHRVGITASLPSVNRSQMESQRGEGVFPRAIECLKKLNAAGYGRPDTNLRLDLVSNPAGAFMPVSQCQAEKQFRQNLRKNWGIDFTRLFTFANAPLGRFRQWLIRSGNYQAYMSRLVSSFNPCTLGGLMCRNMVSVSWDGCIYDCDFNQAAGLPSGGEMTNIARLNGPPRAGAPIATGEHCFACTAGSGFT